MYLPCIGGRHYKLHPSCCPHTGHLGWATSWQLSSGHFPLMKSGNISPAHISHSAEHVLSSDALKMTKITWTLNTPWWLG